jgi:O-Antigen ligase
MVIWPRVTGFLLVGYLCLKKSFAYLGVPPIFIGEIALAAFLLLKPRVILGTWATSLLRPSPLNGLGLALLMFIAYGVWQVGRGVLGGSALIYTLKFFIFNYYPLYLFLGMWIGLQAPDFLPKIVRVIAWVNGVYGLLYVLVLRHVAAQMPGSGGVPLFVGPGGGAIAILGLLCFERNLRAPWFVVVVMLNIVVTAVWQVRSEWMGLTLGLIAWGALTGRPGRVFGLALTGLAAFGMLALADVRLVGRTGDNISLSETLARFIAPINLDLAKEFSPDAARHVGTAEWRELWWREIWRSARSTPMLEAFGHGYGFDLFRLAPPEVRAGQEEDEIRTPHSVFYYALGYTGWAGVALFSLLHFAIIRLLWRSYRLTNQPVGLVFWVTGMGMAFFQASFETPFEAIPFYLLAGLTMAPALQPRSGFDVHLAHPQLYHPSAAR